MNSTNRRAVIFDFDGVVVDSERYWIDMDNSFFPQVAPGYTAMHGQQMMGLGRKAGFNFLVASLGMPLSYEEYGKRLEEAVKVVYFEKCQLMPGLRALVDGLRARNVPIAIASSSRHKWIDGALTRLGLRDAFEVIRTADDVGDRTKPAPDLYLLAAEGLGVAPEDCVAIEDSRNGIASAKAAGMRCIGLRTELSKEQDLSAADALVTTLEAVTPDFLLLPA